MAGWGLDFGTTNSALARSDGGPARLATYGGQPTFRSILFFDPEERDGTGYPIPFTGPEALEHYLDVGSEGRLMQSIKSHLASRSLVGTSVFGRRVTIEDLVAKIVRDLVAAAAGDLGSIDGPVVVGRPVRYVGSKSEADDAWAEGRTRKALALAGLTDVRFVPEPVAAAWHYEQRLDSDETLLIADFGGGTTDYCLMNAGPSHRGRGTARILGTGGVGLAGDRFDGRILERRVAPLMGQGSLYRTPFGRDLEVPVRYFRQLVRWHRLSMLATPKNLRDLDGYLRASHEPEKLERFIHLVRDNLGFALAQAVEGTKVALSSELTTALRYEDDPVDLNEIIARTEFEAWIADDLAELDVALGATLANAGVDSVDRVFLTGGTAFVPAVRALFERRFGAERVTAGDHLTSVASGLALIAAQG